MTIHYYYKIMYDYSQFIIQRPILKENSVYEPDGIVQT